jgi:hypothetical protein
VSPLESLAVFIGIPVALAAVIYALVSAPSWTRGGRASGEEVSGPFLVMSAAAVPDPARLPDELAPANTVAGGGISARW